MGRGPVNLNCNLACRMRSLLDDTATRRITATDLARQLTHHISALENVPYAQVHAAETKCERIKILGYGEEESCDLANELDAAIQRFRKWLDTIC